MNKLPSGESREFSCSRCNPALQRGFTMLELILVITVIAVLAGAAMLKPTNSDVRNLSVTASQLRGFLLAVSADAVRRNENMGVVFQPSAAVILRYSTADGWQAADDSMKPFVLPDGTRLEKKRVKSDLIKVRRAGTNAISPDVLLHSNGETLPFDLNIRHVNLGSEGYVLRSDGLNIELSAL